MEFMLKPGHLKLDDFRLLLDEDTFLTLYPASNQDIDSSEKVIMKVIADNKIVYGINTGFGALASSLINKNDLEILQRSLVLSHATGTGELLSDKAVRLIL